MKPALIRMHIAVFLWGFTGVLGRLISLNEGPLVWWRLLFTSATLWAMFFFTGNIKRVPLKDFFKIAGIGALLALHWLFFYGSIKFANVSIALTCLSTTGLLSAIIEPLMFRTRIKPFELLLGLFALAGIGLIYFSNLHFSVGIYVGLLSAVATTTVSVLNKRIVSGYAPQAITLYQLTGGFLGLSIMLPAYNLIVPAKQFAPVHYDWLWLLLLSWCCTVFTFFLYINALKKVSAFTANLMLTLEPVYGIILAFIIFHENKELHDNFYIGFALIAAAVVLQMMRITRKPKAEDVLSMEG